MKPLDRISLILLVVGGVNWALVGIANFDLVATLLGTMTVLSRIVYVVVGVAAVFQLFRLPAMLEAREAGSNR